MAKTTTELAEKIQPMVNAERPKTVVDSVAAWLNKNQAEIAKALPKAISRERISRVAVTELRTNTALHECDLGSLMAGIMKSAQEGLEFGNGDAYLVPFNKKVKLPGGGEKWIKEAQYIRGYKGTLKLIRRSKEVSNIGAYAVYELDNFDLQLGSDPKVIHRPSLEADRGKLKGFYCCAHIKGEGCYIDWMSLAEVEAIKERSKAKDYGPWVTDFVEMGKKTVLKRASKYLPMEIEIASEIAEDERREFSEAAQVFEMNLGELPEDATEKAES
jgi:recombination protein RecT